MKQFRGITWNHSRGFTSVVATAQRFCELHPEVEIIWEKRSLQAFADQPIDQLAADYDFLIIDHPWAGFAARNQVILPLDKHLPGGYLEDLKHHSVGQSHASYTADDHQWALAIDAATPVASSRPDLLQKKGLRLPKTFDDVLDLAKEGVVIMPGIAQDTLMNFYMMCCTLGEEVCQDPSRVVSDDVGIPALQLLRSLAVEMPSSIYDWNPIQVYEAMTQSDQFVYCPWAYGYSNYSRRGYARHILHFHDLVDIMQMGPAITTLGGTGLAISTQTTELDWAIRYAQYVGSEECQKTVFFDGGGQPGHRQAWLDEHTNNTTCHFFRHTLPALDRAFLRPRYHGHMYFQDRAGTPIKTYLMKGGNEKTVLQSINQLYAKSLSL